MRLLMHIFTETTTSDETPGRSLGNDDEVNTFNLTVFQIFYWDGWEGLKAYTFERRQSKGAHFEKKNSRRAWRG